jgi:hypothetical protein
MGKSLEQPGEDRLIANVPIAIPADDENRLGQLEEGVRHFGWTRTT